MIFVLIESKQENDIHLERIGDSACQMDRPLEGAQKLKIL